MFLQQNYVNSKLATKFGQFNVRVYANDLGKETLVLWTENLDFSLPVLVRVHSECLTGDVIGSLQCDCGKQLSRSLVLISEQGGVLIYLRQEGRGIGLFEKIKSYQLQSEGYDTFQANVLLGHQPDQRTYEMVKTSLDDLNIKRIRLLTNNPSKVSEIAKSGIEVVERVPLLTRSNKHNRVYLETKKNKFQHIFNLDTRHYFYQFQVDTEKQVKEIYEFIKEKKRDPFLKICVGVAAKHSIFSDKKEIARIHSIFDAVDECPGFAPVLHFSFRDSHDVMSDLDKIKTNLPFVKRVQLNDLPNTEINAFKKADKLFSIDVPLSDDNFTLIHNKKFRSIIKKNKSYLLLDNSKGKGVSEAKETLKSKIDLLLSYGVNDIVLCGGFGPNELDRYFDLRRYYRINFSIDAETKLKTNGKFDVEKIKLYLLQLIRFDDPNQQGVEQTKKFLEEHSYSDWDQVKIQDHEFLIHPKVFHAGHFPSTSWFATELRQLTKNNSSFCEVGCGSGVISCLLAISNPKLRVSATDVNPYASENTKKNAEHLGLSSRIFTRTGDVLDNVDSKTRFDTIFWALPFGFLDPGTPIDLKEAQVFDPGYRAIRKLFQTTKRYLKPCGRLLLGFSSDLGNYELLQSIAQEVRASTKVVARTTIQEEVRLQFEILEVVYQPDKDC